MRAGVARPSKRRPRCWCRSKSRRRRGRPATPTEVLANAALTTSHTSRRPAMTAPPRRLLELREAVPSAINALVAAAKARVDPRHPEDGRRSRSCPFERLEDSIALYRRSLESRGLDYAHLGTLVGWQPSSERRASVDWTMSSEGERRFWRWREE